MDNRLARLVTSDSGVGAVEDYPVRPAREHCKQQAAPTRKWRMMSMQTPAARTYHNEHAKESLPAVEHLHGNSITNAVNVGQVV